MKARVVLTLAAAVLTAAAPAPQRVVSLNLCTDELAMLLAAPGQLASVSRLGADARETVLSARAAGLPVNNGRVETVLPQAPDLVLTGGGSPYAAEMAKRLGIAVVDVPPPQTLADIERNIRTIAAALHRVKQGDAVIAAMRANLGPVLPRARSAMFVGGGGISARADGLAAEFLRHAGLAIPPGTGGDVDLEHLLTNAPQVLVLSRYHSSEASLNQSWLAHPALRRLPATTRVISIDGRPWTCLGPPAAAAVAALRKTSVRAKSTSR